MSPISTLQAMHPVGASITKKTEAAVRNCARVYFPAVMPLAKRQDIKDEEGFIEMEDYPYWI